MKRTSNIFKLTASEFHRFLTDHPAETATFDDIENISRALWHLTSVYKTQIETPSFFIGCPSTIVRADYDHINDSLTLACEAYETIFKANTPLKNAAQFRQAASTLARLTSIDRTLMSTLRPRKVDPPEPTEPAPTPKKSEPTPTTSTPPAQTVPICRLIPSQSPEPSSSPKPATKPKPDPTSQSQTQPTASSTKPTRPTYSSNRNNKPTKQKNWEEILDIKITKMIADSPFPLPPHPKTLLPDP